MSDREAVQRLDEALGLLDILREHLLDEPALTREIVVVHEVRVEVAGPCPRCPHCHPDAPPYQVLGRRPAELDRPQVKNAMREIGPARPRRMR